MTEMMIPLLDHGYVKFIETWGSDERIVEAARMSTDKGFLGWGGPCDCGGIVVNDAPCHSCKGTGQLVGDEKLLAYLYSHKHMTPFEMAGMVLEVQAPILVFREWHRHRSQSFNELSARYTPLPNLSYVPTIERLMINAGTSNRQAGTVKGAEILTEASAETFRQTIIADYAHAQETYEAALKSGVPKELARIGIPVGRYSRMRACANLRNWLAFLTLRMAPDAQWEIRQFANATGTFIQDRFPRTWDLFEHPNQG